MYFSSTFWVVALGSGFLVGLSKSGFPGVVTLAIVSLANVMRARESVGFLLPILLAGDICALLRYHREPVLKIVLRLLPWTLPGMAVGALLLGRVDDAAMKKIIAAIVVLLMALDRWAGLSRSDSAIPDKWWFAGSVGVAAGITTVLGNAASPLVILYLAAMRVKKEQFVAANAWCFFVLNCVKVPIFIANGMITMRSFAADIAVFPAVAAGALCGAWALKRISQETFIALAQIAALAGALKLMF